MVKVIVTLPTEYEEEASSITQQFFDIKDAMNWIIDFCDRPNNNIVVIYKNKRIRLQVA